ncbi:BCCT family transporter [Thermovenabulum sp.]|uniref:BCCT family transporter n=1 Tax=Thermovenabulum sp. TaxID=3100335 RepID=UPI003C7BE26C
MKKVKPIVFWPPVVLLIGVVILNFIRYETFTSVVTSANDWIIQNFGWLFSLSAVVILGICIWIYFSPFGDVKIGGADAKPFFNTFEWFMITLCTTIAAGILFWAAAEPIYHITSPPASLGIEPNSHQAAVFAMSTVYLHWTIVPYALYTLPSLMFAFAFYNMRKPFSLSSMLYPLFGEKAIGKWGEIVDAICLYTLVAGMAASLGTGVLTLAGGLNYVFGVKSNKFIWAILIIAIVMAFVISASTGLMRGIRILSIINTRVFFVIMIFSFVFGPTRYILELGTESLGNFLTLFFQKSLFTGAASGDQWPKWWTIFYWANWLAWAPISAMFLGRIAYGRTIKEFIMVNLFAPAMFCGVWMTIYSGTSIYMQMNGFGLSNILTQKGPEGIIYAIFSNMPLSKIIIPFYLFIVFISYVTAADSNTTAMAAMSSTGISPENQEAGVTLKVFWGVIIGLVAWIMISFAGVDGIKMISNLGGFPALFLEILIAIGIIKVARNPKNYDFHIRDNGPNRM